MPVPRNRIVVVCFLLLLACGICVVRLFQIQVIGNGLYSKECITINERRCIIPAQRGMILDRNGKVLAKSIIQEAGTLKKSSSSPQQEKQASLEKEYTRIYPNGELAGSVIGFVGVDKNGLEGIEHSHERYLKGEDGWTLFQRFGNYKRFIRPEKPKKKPINGSDIYVSIDLQIQQIAESELQQAVTKLNAKSGMCLIMEPATGAIRAMVSVPGYDPNYWQRYSYNQRMNRCISSCYEPGSTFKVLTAAIALQENLKNESSIIDGNKGKFEIVNQTIRDHKPYGKLTFTEAISYSSNVCFAKIAVEIGNERLYRYARNFGIGQQVDIGLPGEEQGLIRPPKSWSGRTGVTIAIGQEVSVTLLQMMTVFSAVANGGILLQPYIIEKIVTSQSEIIDMSHYQPRRQVISEANAARLRTMLEGVVTYGTAKDCQLPHIRFAGKTGTSQKYDKEKACYSMKKGWASFMGFVPVDRPVLACGVVIEDPSQAEMGGVAAAPVFASIVQKIVTTPDLEYSDNILQHKSSHDLPVVTASLRESPNSANHQVKKSDKEIQQKSKTASTVAVVPQTDKRTPLDNTDQKDTNKNETIVVTDIRSGGIQVPDCIGKDVRDAVNLLNLKGLVPMIRGFGVVQKQLPPAGTQVKAKQTCHLVCALEPEVAQ